MARKHLFDRFYLEDNLVFEKLDKDTYGILSRPDSTIIECTYAILKAKVL